MLPRVAFASDAEYLAYLRDWFAGHALVGVAQEYLHRNGFHGVTMGQNLAAHAYCIADAMLAERERGQ